MTKGFKTFRFKGSCQTICMFEAIYHKSCIIYTTIHTSVLEICMCVYTWIFAIAPSIRLFPFISLWYENLLRDY